MPGSRLLLKPRKIDSNLSPKFGVVECVPSQHINSILSLYEYEMFHAKSAVCTRGKYEGSFHIAIVSACCQKSTNCATLDAGEVFVGNIGGAKGISNARKMVYSI